MKPFIEAEIERFQKGLKALELCQRKLRIAMETQHSNPLLSLKTAGQAERHMQEYEAVKAELQALWATEEKPVRVDMVTITEDYHTK